jgi:hypothetical protein
MAQVSFIELSAMQRWVLYTFTHDQAAKIKDLAESKKYRRLCKALGLDVISRLQRTVGTEGLNQQYANSDELQAFEVTAENAEFALSLLNRELPTIFHDVCGDVLDLLEDLSRGRVLPPTSAPKYDDAADAVKWRK